MTFIMMGVLHSCVAPTFAIGTNEVDFVKQCKRARQVQASAGSSVYKVGYPEYQNEKFYYFTNGILIKVDQGITQPTIRIENIQKN